MFVWFSCFLVLVLLVCHCPEFVSLVFFFFLITSCLLLSFGFSFCVFPPFFPCLSCLFTFFECLVLFLSRLLNVGWLVGWLIGCCRFSHSFGTASSSASPGPGPPPETLEAVARFDVEICFVFCCFFAVICFVFFGF